MKDRVLNKKNPMVSAIIPVFQEEKYIEQFLNSLLNQTFNSEKIEYIFVDGLSKDLTREHIQNFIDSNTEMNIQLLDNKYQYQVNALNIGIKSSKGEIIIRLDVHSNFPENYIQLCVETLLETGADNVGGLAITKGTNKFSFTAAKLLSSKFGVGNSGFRTFAKSGFVETVPFGTYHKELFQKIGLFDERLIRNEDNEFNYRIIKNGGKIYLNNEIKFEYFCRDSYTSLMKMAFQNGMWNIITFHLIKGSMKIRHFIPFLFFLYIFLGLALIIFCSKLFFPWSILIIVYLIINFFVSAKLSGSFIEFLHLLYLFPSFHLGYGMGSFVGLLRILFRNY